MTDNDDGSTADNCLCDGADDANYTCGYHLDNPEGSFTFERYWASKEYRAVTTGLDLEDAYGFGHYKTGVYDV